MQSYTHEMLKPAGIEATASRRDLRISFSSHQVKCDLKERVREDPDYSSQRFPNTNQAFSLED